MNAQTLSDYNLIKQLYKLSEEGSIDFPEILPYLNNYVKIRTIPQNQYIIRMGSSHRTVRLVLKGSYCEIRESAHGSLIYSEGWEAPSFIGIPHLVLGMSKCMSDMLTLEECIILEVEKGFFLEALESDSDLALIVIKNLSETIINRMRRYDEFLFNFSGGNLLSYIYYYWIESGMEEKTLRIKTKYTSIANSIGISERTLYRALKTLKENGLVTTNKGDIIVTPEQMKRIRDDCNTFTNMYLSSVMEERINKNIKGGQ